MVTMGSVQILLPQRKCHRCRDEMEAKMEPENFWTSDNLILSGFNIILTFFIQLFTASGHWTKSYIISPALEIQHANKPSSETN